MPRQLLAAAFALLCLSPLAQAHFLFIRILPSGEAGRSAEVYFSEIATAGDPKFIDKISSTKLWLQTTPGKFTPLTVHKTSDRLRASVPMGSLGVVGECTYGVLARPKQTAFLLRHYPKAIAGKPDDVNALKPRPEIPLEITAHIDGDAVTLTALSLGKPIPKAVFTTVDRNLANTKLNADEAGKATWKPTAPGTYSIYVSLTTKDSGEHDGKKYAEIRNFATLALTWPMVREEADPKALALFDEAIAARASWKAFPGFTADFQASIDGRTYSGSATVSAKGDCELFPNDPSAADWVREQLESMALHRIDRPRSPGKRPIIYFGDDDDSHPLGKLLVFEGGQFASSYRVKDKQLLVVNRHMGKTNMSITILENDRNAEGQILPRSYAVQYWDAETGALKRTETFHQRWQRVGSWDLPTVNTVMTSTGSGLAVRSFTLTKLEVLKK